MAIYVEIKKIRPSDRGFIYKYVVSDGSEGELELDRTDGSSVPVRLASGDADQRLYALAARKLLKHFEANQFPDETCWAS